MMTNITVQDENETNFLDWIIVLAKRKRLIIITTILIGLLTGVYNFFSDSIYDGIARISLPQGSSATSSAMSQLAAVSAAAGGMIPGITPAGTTVDMLSGLIKTQSVLDNVIKEFNLVEIYKKDRILGNFRSYNIDNCRDDFIDSIMMIEVDSASSIITIHVKDKSSKRAADIANALVGELQKLYERLSLEEATQRKQFYEKQLRQASDSLIVAEQAMQGFQENSGAIQIDEQARAVLGGIALLENQIAAKEVQIKVMKTYAAKQNPELKLAQEELAGLIQQRRKLEQKSDPVKLAVGDTPSLNPIIPTSAIPGLGTDYLRKMRDYKYQEAVYLLILKQFETARLDEIKSPYAIWFIDRAVPPEKRIAPKLILNVILLTGTGFFFSIFLALMLEYFEKLASTPEGSEKIDKIKKYIKKI